MRNIFIWVLLLIPIITFSQSTYHPRVEKGEKKYTISDVTIKSDETIVTILFNGSWGGQWVSFSSNTTLTTQYGSESYVFPIIGLTEHGQRKMLDTRYSTPGKKNLYQMELHFDKIPAGCEILTIRENTSDGFEWRNIHINNPVNIQATTPTKRFTEQQIKEFSQNNNDGICGIYEGISGRRYKFGCIKENDEYILIYLGEKETNIRWNNGDIKAKLRSSASNSMFKAIWYMADKSVNDNAYIVFEGASMKTFVAGEETTFLKMYPTNSNNDNGISSNQNSMWSGSGFALKDGYIVTNYHVVDNAKSIKVQGVNGNHQSQYDAKVIATDKVNDLAVIKLDNLIENEIPYSIKLKTIDIGEEIFVLGYPLITTMGKDIKLTTGVISSKSGFMGDVALYQISAPIQPGNSGGPLFDNKGNLVGIICAKHAGAENASYAIKTSYLNNLLESASIEYTIPTTNSLSSLSFTDKIKKIEDYVYLIICSN